MAPDALGGDRGRVDARTEREHREHDELVSGVVAVDVERGVGLGVALCPGPRAMAASRLTPPSRMRVST